ncbi:hypothetical protein LUZ60_002306 [Juncus effusus]|nr:hypothetical protein LUZ60_002306 [Juncus effusus]
MGATQSKEQFLYEQVNYGNIEGIKSLRNQGAGLEWVDKDGKTPLILACLRHDLFHVAKLLIELGANVNAYRPGSFAGTPLHHAAKKGIEPTVLLLLSHGVNPFIMNDDCHTALDLAREKGHLNVVRAIESRICLFSGWLRENYGPGFLEAFAPNLLSRKIWAVVIPSDSRNPARPQKFDLAIYPDLQVAKPLRVIHLSKCHIEEPRLSQSDPHLFIIEKSTRAKHKFLSGNEGDKAQLQAFYTACRGIPQVINMVPMPVPPHVTTLPTLPAVPAMPALPSVPAMPALPAVPALPSVPVPPSQQSQEEMELAMAINASIQSAIIEGVPNVLPIVPASNSNSNTGTGYNGWSPPSPKKTRTGTDQASSSHSGSNQPNPLATQTQLAPPSAPPINDQVFYTGAIQYPSIDSTPVNFTNSSGSPIAVTTAAPTAIVNVDGKNGNDNNNEGKNNNNSNNNENDVCVICLDAKVEGACIPCGHMAGCMACLKEIEEKRGECPICRAKISQVLRLYHV